LPYIGYALAHDDVRVGAGYVEVVKQFPPGHPVHGPIFRDVFAWGFADKAGLPAYHLALVEDGDDDAIVRILEASVGVLTVADLIFLCQPSRVETALAQVSAG
jgi:hypothetical protein